MSNISKPLIFIAVFFSSIVGAQIGPVPINTLACVPLLIYFIISRRLIINFKDIYILFCLTAVLSCLFALLRPYGNLTGYTSSQIVTCIQNLCFYIPIYLVINRDQELITELRQAFVITYRVQVVWALVQYICWSFFNFDLNNFVLVDMFGGLGRNSWTMTSNLGTASQANIALRLSGLNYDGAFLGLIILVGIVLDKSLVFKIIGISVIFVSMQRSSLVGLCALAVGYIAHSFANGKFKVKVSASTFIIIVLSVILVVYCLLFVDEIQNRIVTLISRFDFTASLTGTDSGTLRHILYIPESFILLFSISPLIFLFGVGPKSSGIIFLFSNNSLSDILIDSMKASTWSIESDIAAVVAGMGYVGLILYVCIFIKIFYSNNWELRILAFAILIFGITYGFSHLIFSHLLYTYLLSVNTRSSKYRNQIRANAYEIK